MVHIPITEELSDCLQWLWKERHIAGDFQEYVIPDAAKIYLEDAPLLSYRIRVFLEGLGIKTRKLNSNGRNQSIKDFHSLRHTHATMLVENGAPLKYVQRRLGHKKIDVTMNIYQHLTEALREQGNAVIESMF